MINTRDDSLMLPLPRVRASGIVGGQRRADKRSVRPYTAISRRIGLSAARQGRISEGNPARAIARAATFSLSRRRSAARRVNTL